MRDIEGDDGILESWNQAMKGQRLRKAVDSQSINITLLASTPMHDRLTFERSEAIKEKMDERLRAAGPGKLYEGWMDEIESKVAKYEGEQKEKRSLVAGSKRQGKIPISNRCVILLNTMICFYMVKRSSQRAGSSASGASRPQEQRTPFVTVRNSGRESPMIVDVDDDDLEPRKRHPEKNKRHTFRAQDNNCIIDLE